MIKPQTLKGFRDFLPAEARKRAYVADKLKRNFELFGFEPLETPALEYEDILMGKYGDEGNKLMYRFTDNGDRRVALRYDQTVPLARVIAQYQNSLPLPFKRYQLQPVWRAENTQKGRYREFLQCDIDIVGSASPVSDLEILQCVDASLKSLGLTDFKILINDRRVFQQLGSNSPAIIRILDKEDKIGRDGVIDQLTPLAGSAAEAARIYDLIKNLQPDQLPPGFVDFLKSAAALNLDLCPNYLLARGLDYYTDLIFEVVVPALPGGSLGGGGRYNGLIGMFSGQSLPAVGFAFGFDRLIEALDELKLLPSQFETAKIMITTFSPELVEASLQLAKSLRQANINTDIYLDSAAKLDKQLKYASAKGIPYVAILGPEELSQNLIKLKNMSTGSQSSVTLSGLINLMT